MRTGNHRWAISFADICLLLLGFLLISQAHRKDGGALAEGIRTHLGGKPVQRVAIDPSRMFEPGEAVLRPKAPALEAFGPQDRVIIESRGVEKGGERFDGWELAAARTAALARAVTAAGAAPDQVTIDMAETKGQQQRLTIVRR